MDTKTMNYGNLFSRAWNIVWENKFLILLGVLATISGTGGGSAGSQGASTPGDDFGFHLPPQFDFDLSAPLQSVGLPVLSGLLILFILAIVIGIWALGVVARGGLIFGVDTISREQPTTFAKSFQAGRKKGWRLIGIGLLPAIPILALIVLGFIGAVSYSSTRVVVEANEGFYHMPNALIFIPVVALALGIFLVLSLLRTFAERACMLENTGVWGSYRKGAQILGQNLGSALILFVLQILISIGIGLALLLPGIVIALCCFLWPLLLLAQGTFAAFYSTLWTLAWNHWTGVPDVVGANKI